jgi:hypothetical protein
MSSPTPDRRALERLWLNRLNDAKLRLDFARNYLAEVQRDYPSRDIPEHEHHFAHNKAVRAEDIALAEYNRVLRVYTDLTVDGIIPDESEWLKAQPAGACGGEFE